MLMFLLYHLSPLSDNAVYIHTHAKKTQGIPESQVRGK